MRRLAAFFILMASAYPARAETDVRAQAAGMLSAMEGNAQRVQAMLRRVRQSGPAGAPQARCIDQALSRVDAAVRGGREDLASVRAAIASDDAQALRRALTSLTHKRAAAHDAAITADTCLIGGGSANPDQTVVHIVIPKLPSNDVVFAR